MARDCNIDHPVDSTHASKLTSHRLAVEYIRFYTSLHAQIAHNERQHQPYEPQNDDFHSSGMLRCLLCPCVGEHNPAGFISMSMVYKSFRKHVIIISYHRSRAQAFGYHDLSNG